MVFQKKRRNTLQHISKVTELLRCSDADCDNQQIIMTERLAGAWTKLVILLMK